MFGLEFARHDLLDSGYGIAVGHVISDTYHHSSWFRLARA
jgi:hypothetical protein